MGDTTQKFLVTALIVVAVVIVALYGIAHLGPNATKTTSRTPAFSWLNNQTDTQESDSEDTGTDQDTYIDARYRPHPTTYVITRFIPRSSHVSSRRTTTYSSYQATPTYPAYSEQPVQQYTDVYTQPGYGTGTYPYGCSATTTYSATTGLPCNGAYNNNYYNQYQY